MNTEQKRTLTVRFVACGRGNDIEVPDVPVYDEDEISDIIDRAAEIYCPADTACWDDMDDDDDRKWDGSYDPSDDNFGAGFFFRDNGISTPNRWYGQIFRPVSERLGNGNSSVTGRVFVDLDDIREVMAANQTDAK